MRNVTIIDRPGLDRNPLEAHSMTMYYVRVAYYDGTPSDVEFYETREEAAESCQTAIEQREQLGQQFGDCSSISWGLQHPSDGSLKKPIRRVEFD
jgi:hypothetical protein